MAIKSAIIMSLLTAAVSTAVYAKPVDQKFHTAKKSATKEQMQTADTNQDAESLSKIAPAAGPTTEKVPSLKSRQFKTR